MNDTAIKQFMLVTQDELDPTLASERLGVLNLDGSEFTSWDGPPGADGADGADGSDGSDALNFLITISETAIGVAAKTTTDGLPYSNRIVPVLFVNGNSAAAITFSFEGSDPYPVLLSGATPTGAEITIAANGYAFFYYDGVSFHQLGVYS